jgi:hypothetical protein
MQNLGFEFETSSESDEEEPQIALPMWPTTEKELRYVLNQEAAGYDELVMTSDEEQEVAPKMVQRRVGFVGNESLDNRQPKSHYTLQVVEHYICCLMFFGIEQAGNIVDYSPVFSGLAKSIVVNLRLSVLAKSSVVGFGGYKLNIYKLALFNRCKFMLAKAMKYKKQYKNGMFVEIPCSKKRKVKREFNRKRMLEKYFLASEQDLRMAESNIVFFQRYNKVLPINFERTSAIGKLVFLQRLEDMLKG